MADIISEAIFKRYWQYIPIPGLSEVESNDDPTPNTSSQMYKRTKNLVKVCCDTWQNAWSPGEYLTVDEHMVFWTGTGEMHITYLPRKPTPYGVEIKSACCGMSNVVLNLDLVEGKHLDSLKLWRD
jgi:hypothetical protein